jgi:xanthine dehydrogenase accessory factor
MSVFVEPQGRRPLLVMFGAGHVGRALTSLAHGCGFRVVVVDERPDCAVPSLLPGADEILCAPVGDAFGRLKLDRESFVVIATPGHLHDFDAVRGCLSTEAGFIGLLGSRRKRETLLQILEEEGVDAAQRARIVTPVGLDIGAQTPEEIAVSIVGQLIAIRSGK